MMTEGCLQSVGGPRDWSCFSSFLSCSRLTSFTLYMLECTHIPDVLALIQLKSGSHDSLDHANHFAFCAKSLAEKSFLSNVYQIFMIFASLLQQVVDKVYALFPVIFAFLMYACSVKGSIASFKSGQKSPAKISDFRQVAALGRVEFVNFGALLFVSSARGSLQPYCTIIGPQQQRHFLDLTRPRPEAQNSCSKSL